MYIEVDLDARSMAITQLYSTITPTHAITCMRINIYMHACINQLSIIMHALKILIDKLSIIMHAALDLIT